MSKVDAVSGVVERTATHTLLSVLDSAISLGRDVDDCNVRSVFDKVWLSMCGKFDLFICNTSFLVYVFSMIRVCEKGNYESTCHVKNTVCISWFFQLECHGEC